MEHWYGYDILAPANSTWYGSKRPTPFNLPLGIVWHYTANPHERGAAKLLAERRQRPKKLGQRTASWHYTISRVGKVWQHVPCNYVAWHCRKGSILGHKVNSASIGIEIVSRDGTDVTPLQYDAIGLLLHQLQNYYGIPGWHAIYSHQQFDPDRRNDPGPEVMKFLKDTVV